jgi:hypothetical protein
LPVAPGTSEASRRHIYSRGANPGTHSADAGNSGKDAAAALQKKTQLPICIQARPIGLSITHHLDATSRPANHLTKLKQPKRHARQNSASAVRTRLQKYALGTCLPRTHHDITPTTAVPSLKHSEEKPRRDHSPCRRRNAPTNDLAMLKQLRRHIRQGSVSTMRTHLRKYVLGNACRGINETCADHTMVV